uniref:FA core complex associated protein 20 n=1 Tax=Callithrix jacchus TaxID=9483 RepID=A0A2R8M859_CALJA
MEAARRPRLGLSRRKPPPAGGPSGDRPWFLLGGDERERLWVELLRTVSPELSLDEELPPLPAFPGQERSCSPGPTEVFTVGPKTFSWTPFPPNLWGPGCSYRLLRRAGGHLESPDRSPPQHPTPDLCRAPSVEPKPSVEGATVLHSCPMCQKEFAPGHLDHRPVCPAGS